MNSKADLHQPTVGRVVVTRELQELQGQEEGEEVAREEAEPGGGVEDSIMSEAMESFVLSSPLFLQIWEFI